MGDKKVKNQYTVFGLYSCGVKTNRDSWVYNFSKNQLGKNMKSMIDFYNQELNRLKDKKLNTKNIDNFINRDDKKIKWTRKIKKYFIKKESLSFNEKCVRQSSYRPFMKSWLYFSGSFNEEIYHNDKIFTKDNIENKVICISGVGEKTFSVLITDNIPNFHYMPSGQCFPLYWFDKSGSLQEGITNSTLDKFRSHYKDNSSKKIEKEDVFYYIYGLLHSEDYRAKYKDNLDKTLPHIPLVSDFWQFSNIGRQLAEFHLNYETQKPPEGIRFLKTRKRNQHFRTYSRRITS